MTTDNKKQSIYFQEKMLIEIYKEADRLDRSVSWVVQRAWKTARKKIKSIKNEKAIESSE